LYCDVNRQPTRETDSKIDTARRTIVDIGDRLGKLQRAKEILLDADFEVEPRPADPLQAGGNPYIGVGASWKNTKYGGF